jgi:hypothetical protein
VQTATASFKLVKKVRDDRFEEERLNECALLIQIGVRDIQVAVVEDASRRVVLLEDYVLGELQSHDELFQLLQNLFDSHPLLLAGFWQSVIISFKNSKFAQVPPSLFVEERAADYLKINAALAPEEKVLWSRHGGGNLITVFAVQSGLLTWLQKVYANTRVTYTHQSVALVEGLLPVAANQVGDPLYIYVDRFKLHILAYRQGKLLYYNQFLIKQFADYVKYIMVVMKGLGMDAEKTRVVLWGYIGKNSPHYQEFYKYVRNVEFGGRPAGLEFGYLFDEVQEHHFYDLFALMFLPS